MCVFFLSLKNILLHKICISCAVMAATQLKADYAQRIKVESLSRYEDSQLGSQLVDKVNHGQLNLHCQKVREEGILDMMSPKVKWNKIFSDLKWICYWNFLVHHHKGKRVRNYQ